MKSAHTFLVKKNERSFYISPLFCLSVLDTSITAQIALKIKRVKNTSAQQVPEIGRSKALFSSHPINPVNAKKNITSNVSTHAWSTK